MIMFSDTYLLEISGSASLNSSARSSNNPISNLPYSSRIQSWRFSSKKSLSTASLFAYIYGIPRADRDITQSPEITIEVLYKGLLEAHAIFLVYDITNADTFQNLQDYWMLQVEEHAAMGVKMVLIGIAFETKEINAT